MFSISVYKHRYYFTKIPLHLPYLVKKQIIFVQMSFISENKIFTRYLKLSNTF